MERRQETRTTHDIGMAEPGIDRFRSKRKRAGASEGTVDQYTEFVGMVRGLSGRPILELGVAEVEALDEKLLGRAKVLRTVLKMFLRANGRYDLDAVLERQSRPQKQISEDEVLTPNDVMKLIAVCTSKRDRALVAVMASTGGRVNEILGLRLKRIAKVRGDGWQAEFVNTKTRKNRYSPRIEGTYKDLLEAWITVHPSRGDPEAWVFPSTRDLGEPLNDGTVNVLLEGLRRKAGVEKRANAHALRHARVTWGMMNHENAAALSQAIWGRPVSAMLNRYSHFSGKESEPVGAERVELPDVPALPVPPVLATGKHVAELQVEVEDLRAQYDELIRALDFAIDRGMPDLERRGADPTRMRDMAGRLEEVRRRHHTTAPDAEADRDR